MHVIRKYLCYSAGLPKTVLYQNARWKKLIFHLIDSEKQELAPVTNWFYCMNHIFSGIDHSCAVQMSRGVHHIIDSGQSWEDKECFFPHYCRWILQAVKSFLYNISRYQEMLPHGWVNKMSKGFSCKPTTQLFIWFCGPSFIFTTSMSMDHSCFQLQLWNIDCLYCQCYY